MNLRMRGLWILFIANAFLSAALLFLSEPMVAKLLLPLFGGSPAVWNTCMVFFQAALLLGYAYSHWSIRKFGLKYQAWLQGILVLLPLLVLPFALPAWAGDNVHQMPVVQILAILAVTVGGPFFVLSTTGPLLQRWFAATRHPGAREPYFLYAASNLGSFVALLGYPLLLEPSLTLGTQAMLWAVAYGLYAACTIGCIVALHYNQNPKAFVVVKTAVTRVITWAQRVRWMGLSFIPSSLMLGVTMHLTTDVASVPLLWVIPLAIYLLTFVIAFGRPKPMVVATKLAPWAVSGLFGAVILMATKLPLPSAFAALFFLCVFALIALVAHAKLAANRPPAAQLTEFYLWVAVGGVTGGIFNSLVAPLIFNNIYEFPLVLLLGLPVLIGSATLLEKLTLTKVLWALLPIGLFLGIWAIIWAGSRQTVTVFAECLLAVPVVILFFLYRAKPAAVGLAMVPLLTLPIGMMMAAPSILTQRTFYGVIKVEQRDNRRVLVHGITQHGSQDIRPEFSGKDMTYYHHDGPVGDIMRTCQATSPCEHVGVIGLGTGTMATYGRQSDTFTFYEIDPAIIHIAKNPAYFTYLRDSIAKTTEVKEGDGRLQIAKAPDGAYDVLVIDAFSSDAIPTHLLTQEAMALYARKLSPQGIMAFHISNRVLNLEPILFAGAQKLGMSVATKKDQPKASEKRYSTHWVVVAPSSHSINALQASTTGWRDTTKGAVRPWTDDYSNIVDAIGY